MCVRVRIRIRIRVRVRVRERHGTDPSIDASGASGRTELYYPLRQCRELARTKRKGSKGYSTSNCRETHSRELELRNRLPRIGQLRSLDRKCFVQHSHHGARGVLALKDAQ